ncbi:hypothetical protein [Winogradskyella sp.]|uniref:hypothetical protein n=1 Tax=Winogradskyella sp. TaxID=1883156 RepID=UPI003AB653F3
MNLPEDKQIEKIIAELKNCDWDKVSEEKIIKKIRELNFIPFPTSLLKKGFYVDRIRVNNDKELFYSEKEISYRDDYHNIKKYGRANLKNQSLFYGAFESENIKHPRFVNLIETSEIYRNIENYRDLNSKFYVTLGRWELIKETEVLEIIFDNEFLNKSEENKKAYQFHSDKLKTIDLENETRFKKILEFFSSEFAKKEIKNDNYYKASAIYFNMSLMSSESIAGVKYPSVKSDYLGYNLALLPNAFERNFRLKNVVLLEIDKKRMNTTIKSVNSVKDFGPMNSKFKWMH